MDGISLHYYTVGDWNNKGSATDFNTEDYYWTLGKCLEIEDVGKKHIAIMDKYDPKKNIALMVDEWGTWWDVEPTNIDFPPNLGGISFRYSLLPIHSGIYGFRFL